MKIRQHVFTLGRCIYCGAKDLPTLAAEAKERGFLGEVKPDERSCIEREDGQNSLRPEPARRQLACEDADAIHAAMIAIREAAKPRCPSTKKTVHDCLRTSARCPETCPHHEFWVGPELPPEAAGAYC